MASYALANKGFMFVLTEYGFEQKAPRAVFCNKEGVDKVPASWVQKGYVTQVPIKVEE